MIKELTRDLVSHINKDYPELEELNLSSNGNYSLLFLTPRLCLEITIVQNLDILASHLQ